MPSTFVFYPLQYIKMYNLHQKHEKPQFYINLLQLILLQILLP